MMKPRSAPVASMAESITSTSTSSSTRDEPESAQPIEQRRQRPEIDDARRVARMRLGASSARKIISRAAAASQANLVAMAQRPLGDLLVVDERAASRPAILQHEPSVVQPDDFGVLARHVGADRPQIALALAADAKHRLVDDDDAPAERIVDLEPRESFGAVVSGMVNGFRLEHADFEEEAGEVVDASLVRDLSVAHGADEDGGEAEAPACRRHAHEAAGIRA